MPLKSLIINAWKNALQPKNILLFFPVFFLLGLFILICDFLASYLGSYGAWCLHVFSLFFAFIPLSAFATFLLLRSESEITSFQSFAKKNWEILIGGTTLPGILFFAAAILSLLIGFFVLLDAVPYVGPFFSTLLLFVPLLLVFATFLLFLAFPLFLFFFLPIVALQKTSLKETTVSLFSRFSKTAKHFSYSFLLGILPLVFLFLFFWMGKGVVRTFFSPPSLPVLFFQNVSFLLPFSLLIAPSFLFFLFMGVQLYKRSSNLE